MGAANEPRVWFYRNRYGALTITKWRPWKTLWVFIIEAYG